MRNRLKPGGPSCRPSEWSASVWLGGGVVRGQRAVHRGGAYLQHPVGAARRPAHLLVGAHAPVQQALNRAFGRRRGDGLAPVQGGGVVDDQVGLSVIPSSNQGVWKLIETGVFGQFPNRPPKVGFADGWTGRQEASHRSGSVHTWRCSANTYRAVLYRDALYLRAVSQRVKAHSPFTFQERAKPWITRRFATRLTSQMSSLIVSAISTALRGVTRSIAPRTIGSIATS